MNRIQFALVGLFLTLFGGLGAVPVSAESSGSAGSREVTGEGAGVSFAAKLPAGYELQGLGPEWYVVEQGTTQPLVLVKFQVGKTMKGMVPGGFERVDERKPVEFGDGVTGALVVGSYEAPPKEEYVQPWYLHPAPGADGLFMIAEYRARPWAPFREFAESFRQVR